MLEARFTAGGGVGSAGVPSGDVVLVEVVVGSSVGVEGVLAVAAGSVGMASVALADEADDVVTVAEEVAVELIPGTVMMGSGIAPERGMVGCARTFRLQARMFVILAGRFQPRAVGSSSFSGCR